MKRNTVTKPPILDALNNNSIKRVGYMIGIRRFGSGLFDAVRGKSHDFFQDMIRNAINYTEYGRRKTVTEKDAKMALEFITKRDGRVIYPGI